MVCRVCNKAFLEGSDIEIVCMLENDNNAVTGHSA